MAVVLTLPDGRLRSGHRPSRRKRSRTAAPRAYSGIVAVIFLLQCAVVGAEAQRWMAQTPFAGLAGTWSGSGTVSLSGGARERIRCRSTYQVGGEGTVVRG